MIGAERRPVCVKMGHALVEAVKFAHERPAETLAILRKHFPQIDPAIVEPAFAVTERALPATPLIVEAAIANADRLNIEAGFMKPEEKLTSYEDLYTNEFVR